ncbi:hypothetical protein GCM10023231_18160 [Olivibacter ginsenosidimutans]|uniref:Intracellular proteinase inhibitor BsuPI domain-containing protein n=2 Tax=Olivibacter ginsenosidimutans TaxID=1176537 RepID=A0ABP9B5C6_9SPHI
MQCQQPASKQNQSQESREVVQKSPVSTTADTSLVAVLRIDSIASLSDSLFMVFKVYNPSPDTLRFTQYHTPFEGFLNNFLTVTDEQGQEIPYRGAMAKRVMPPPEETYCTVAPSASDSIRFSLLKGYAITKPGLYTIEYNAGNVSGMSNGHPVRVNIIP